MSLIPERMKTVKISVPKGFSRELLRLLSSEEIEIIDMQKRPFNIDTFDQGPRIKELSDQFDRLIDHFDIEKWTLSQKTKKIIIDAQDLNSVLKKAEQLSKEHLKPLNKIREQKILAEKELEKQKAIKELARYLTPFGLSFDDLVDDAPYFQIIVGKMETKRIPRFKWNLDAIADGNFILKDSPTKDRFSVIAVGFLEQYQEDINRLLIAYGFEKFSIPERVSGSSDKVLQKSDQKAIELEAKVKELDKQARQIIEICGMDLLAYREQLEIEVGYLKVQNMLRVTDKGTLLWGWVPQKQAKKIERELETLTGGKSQVEFSTPVFDEEEYPVKTSVPKFARIFDALVNAYGTPGYGEFNPALFFLITYPIIFGIMFADVGHGLLFTLLGVYGWFIRNKKLDKTTITSEVKSYFQSGYMLIILSGIISMIWGVIFGSYFGITHHHLQWIPEPLWFSPESHDLVNGTSPVILMLELSLFVGMLHMTIGYILRLLTNIRHKHFGEAICVTLMIIIFHWTVFILVFTFGTNFMEWFDWNNSGAFDLALFSNSQGLPVQFFTVKHALLLFIIGFALPPIIMTGYLLSHGWDGFAELIELVLSTFSNTVSYARIFAMNAVHGALSQIFLFTMFTGEHFGVINFIGAAIGAFVIVALEGLFSFLQTLRLQWVEFFGKVGYQGSGTKFRAEVFERKYSIASSLS